MLGAPADQAIVSDREETKYLVALPERRKLIAALNERLPAHRHRGEGANTLPGPEHFVTTVYFDTPTLAHFHAATRDGEQHVKLRVKEYYDVHPSLAELATEAAEVLHRSPFVWLELKRRSGSRSLKQRVRLDRQAVDAWLAGQGAAESADAESIRDYCVRLGEPLSARGLVNYRRASWQAPDDAVRVTLDTELSFFSSLPDLWKKPALSRGELGRPLRREPNLLVEVKRPSGDLPSWLEQALHSVRATPVTYSKFVRAMESVFGP